MTTTLRIPLDDNLKHEATPILAEYGLSFEEAMQLFFKEIVETRTVPLNGVKKELAPEPSEEKNEEPKPDITVYATLDDFYRAVGVKPRKL